MTSSAETGTKTVLLYSDDPLIRDRMRTAVGRRPASDIRVEYLDATSYDETIRLVDGHRVDLVLLDGEAWPAGGLGIARQLRDELTDGCPLTCVVLARAADRWLAAWSRADAVLIHPLDPVRTAETVADLLRRSNLTDAVT
jgi:DNA-binding response OmpR family regulator